MSGKNPYAILADTMIVFSGGFLLYGPGVHIWQRAIGAALLLAGVWQFDGWRNR